MAGNLKNQAVKIGQPLSLDKETIARLDEQQLGLLEGGLTNPTTLTCNDPTPVNAEYCHACSCNG